MTEIQLSIITPTYNRGYILSNLFGSLCRQTVNSFEWIVLDDGSNDNTKDIVENWGNQNINFEIRYIRQSNGGKHRALNKGIRNARYDFVYIIDSDDYMTDDAVEKIYKWINSIKGCEGFAGVSGLRGTKNREIIGQFPSWGKYIDATNLERKKYKLLGDKAEIYRRDILMQYPFPEFENEKFLGEGAVWNKIAGDGYKIRWFGEIICICEYLEDGLTKNHNSQVLLENFEGYTYVEKLNTHLRSFPNNFLAVGRYFFIAKQKGITLPKIKKRLDISYFTLIFGILFGIGRMCIRKVFN